jgi:hypothetical protein
VEVRLTYESPSAGIPSMMVRLEDGDGRIVLSSAQLPEQLRRRCVYATILPGRTIEAARVSLDLTAETAPETVIHAQVYPVLAFARQRVYCHGGLENATGPGF